MGTTRLLYARALLHCGGLPRTPAHEMCLVAIMSGEDSGAQWNPLDTTLPMTGATPYNSFGNHDEYHVWNYPDAEIGLKATWQTMTQANMRPWLSQMRIKRTTATHLAAAFAQTPWGGVGDTLPLRLIEDYQTKRRSYESDAHSWVEGGGTWLYKRNGKPLH